MLIACIALLIAQKGQKRKIDFLNWLQDFFDEELDRVGNKVAFHRRKNKWHKRFVISNEPYATTYIDIWQQMRWSVLLGLPEPHVKRLMITCDPVPGDRFSTVRVKRCYKRFHKKYNNDGILQFVVDELNRQNAWSSRYRFLGNKRLRTLASSVPQSASPRKGSQRCTTLVGVPLLYALGARQGKSPKEDDA